MSRTWCTGNGVAQVALIHSYMQSVKSCHI